MRQKTDAQSVYVVLSSLLREDVIEFPNVRIATLYSLLGGGLENDQRFPARIIQSSGSGR